MIDSMQASTTLDRLLALAPSTSRDVVTEGEIARLRLPHGPELVATCAGGILKFGPIAPDDAYLDLVLERWRSGGEVRALPPWLLNVFYVAKRLLPRSWQLEARRRLMRWQGTPSFPRWPVDTSVSDLLRFYAFAQLRSAGIHEARFAWFWPDGKDAALVLSHDVEGETGLRNLPALADLEEELGFRSVFNLGAWLEVDPGLLADLTGRGFEIGVHGLRHDRSLWASRAAFDAQLPGLAALRKRLGADGFRSPAIHRNIDWMPDLPFDYDATFPNSDPWEAQPGGCCSVWPFFIGPLVELPYTLPQDHTLFTLLGHRSPELWIDTAAEIEAEHGLIQVIAHPDDGYLGDARKRASYAEFLRAMAEREHVWRAVPKDVSAWWRRRAEAPREHDGTVTIGGGPEEVLFERSDN